MTRTAALAALSLWVAPAALPQDRFEFWPGAVYDPAIPTHEKVLGYAAGERISSHANLVRYLEALAAAAPRRTKVFDYGKTWEGRRLVYAAVASESNIARLDALKSTMQRLADPRKTPAVEAKKLMAGLPAVIWLGYGVHGNEISSPDAALLMSYHLLAARNDAVVKNILDNVVVLIDPLQNPDGRDRFVRHFEQSEGIEPDPFPQALEHTEPWPGGRTNHYHFDMNRDWLALTQPETRGRVNALLEWYPLVFVDLHEMGSESTYYFAPEAVPYNPHLTAEQRSSLDWFGKNNAKWFDQYGFSYFTREVYDAFYPGYGASWPAYYGAIAMTYEQASARGLLMRRSDETVFHFRDTVRQHFVASVATAETAARQRTLLLENFYRYRQTAIEEGGREPVREYILPRRGDVAAVDKLADLLAAQGVEVKRATAPFRSGATEYPAGSYVIPLAQPAKRLIRTLMDEQVSMEKEFLEEQERRRRKKLGDEIYDVTAWALPMLYNVEAVTAGSASEGQFEAVRAGVIPPGRVAGGKAEVAYLAPWSTAAGRMLAAALRQGHRVHAANKGFKQNGREFPRGTLIFRVKENPASLHAAMEKLAASSGAEVVATNTGWVEEGINFGSRHVVHVKKPAMAIAWDQGVAAYSAGHTRFVLERQYHFPTTPIRTQLLGAADLSRFDVLILPEGNYGTALGGSVPEKIKAWVNAGGTLIGIGGGAIGWLADAKVELLAVTRENLPRGAEPPKPAEPKDGRVPGKVLEKPEDYEKAIQADDAPPDSVAGVILRARTDPDHWLTAGVPDTVHAVVTGTAVWTPIKLDKGVNAAVFETPEKLPASGYLWEENRRLLGQKPLAIVQRHGRGHVIGFTADPNFRAYLDGMNTLFLNAVFRGPANAR